MMKSELDWRNIFDCKMAGTTLDGARDQARKAGYAYFCHNARIFVTEDMQEVECIKIIVT